MIYPYLIGSGNWGSYSRARSFSLKAYSQGNPILMAEKSGAEYNTDEKCFVLKAFGQELTASFPGGDVFFRGTKHQPYFGLSLPVLNYLVRADGHPLGGSLISYRELEDGHVYYAAFRRESIDFLASSLSGKDPDLFAKAAEDLGGTITEGADLAFVIYALPRFPVTVKLWFPDDEIEGSANILFDSSGNHYLHTEDIAAIGELTARYLVKHYEFLESARGI